MCVSLRFHFVLLTSFSLFLSFSLITPSLSLQNVLSLQNLYQRSLHAHDRLDNWSNGTIWTTLVDNNNTKWDSSCQSRFDWVSRLLLCLFWFVSFILILILLWPLSLDAPGANHEDIDLSVSNGILDVRINRKTPHDREVGIHHRTERRFAERHRRLRLPTNADGENPQANLCEGVLKITFPKVGDSSLVKKIPVMQR
jgi:hypothetical protein